MEIDIRKGGICGHATWREVRIKEGGTTINFDVSEGNELNSFREAILSAVFGDMSTDEVIKYLNESGYSEEIIERYEEEKSEAA
ncbi:hypothetical protein V4833_21925 [Enterobacter sp. HK169]|uniref:hypothetical protein n=1 Tax=Enterobacter sp. HK169 TaxID=1868135 RepID=UPI002F3F9F12